MRLNLIKLSIIVPVYNVERFINDCVESLMNQTHKDNFEVIFVNDGSTDSSYTKLKSLCSTDHRFRIFSKENGGLSSARNFGLIHAKGDYISFLDSDDWVDNVYVENIVNQISKSKSDLYYFDRVFVKKTHSVKTNLPCYNGKLRDYKILESINISACNKVYHKSLFGNNKFPIGVIYEDFPFMFKVYANISTISKIPGHLYYVRQTNPDSITSGIHAQELDMISNMHDVDLFLKKIEDAPLYDMFERFKTKTIVSWTMKLFRGGKDDYINRIDFSTYSIGHLESTTHRVLLLLLKLKFYRVIKLLLFIQNFINKI